LHLPCQADQPAARAGANCAAAGGQFGECTARQPGDSILRLVGRHASRYARFCSGSPSASAVSKSHWSGVSRGVAASTNRTISERTLTGNVGHAASNLAKSESAASAWKIAAHSGESQNSLYCVRCSHPVGVIKSARNLIGLSGCGRKIDPMSAINNNACDVGSGIAA
jgi:hypothetical protein